MRKLLNKLLTQFDAEIVRQSFHNDLIAKQKKYKTYEMADVIGGNFRVDYFSNIENSHSQIFQDLFALSISGFKKNGFL